MENFLALMNSISDSWVSPSSMVIAMDMIIAFLCGAGLVFLLLPSLKESPESPPPESERDIPKDVKRWKSNTRKKTATVKELSPGGRGGRKYVEGTRAPSQSMKISTKQLLQDSTPQSFGSPNQKMDHFPLFQLLSYLKILEHLIHKEFSHIFWGISSMFSESLVATAHVLRNPSLAEHRTVRFRDACDPDQALSQAKTPPQLTQDLLLPPELVTPCLEHVTGVQDMEMVPDSATNQTPPCFKSRTCGIACPTTERGTQTSLPTENQPWQHGLHWIDTKGYDIQNHQAASSKPTGKLPRGILHSRAIGSAPILPDSCQMVYNNDEPQNEDKATNGGEQQGTHVRFLPSRKLTQLQGHFPANNDDYCKSRPQLSQPAQPSILNSKTCTCNKMVGSVPLGVPLKKDITTCDIHNSIKKGPGLESQDLPCTLSSGPGKGQTPRTPSLRTDKMSYLNPAELRSFLDSRTESKLAPNITKLPRKRGKRPYLEILEARDCTPPGIPASNIPQVGYPSSPICDSKAEYYSKAATVLENLHHQDPGGTRVKSVSDARLESAVSVHSPADIQDTQRMPPPVSSHEASKAHPDPRQRSLTVQQPAFCFQVKPQQSTTMQDTGTGSLQPSSSSKIANHGPQKRFQDVDSGQPGWRVIVIDPEERAPPWEAKPTNTVDVKEESPPSQRLSLESSEINDGQAISISSREFGSSEANKRPSHLQSPTLQHSQESGQKPQTSSMIDLISKEQPQPWLVRHDPDGPSTIHPTKVSLPAEHSLPRCQNKCEKPQDFQGLGDVCTRSHERVETEETSIPKDTAEVKGVKGVHPHEEGWNTIRSRAMSQEERLGSVRPSIPSSTQIKDIIKTWIPEKGEATSNSSWNALQYEKSSKKCLGQGDSFQDDCTPSAAEQIHEAVIRNKAIYNMIAEIQSLVNILVRILETTEGAPSEVQGFKVESLTSKLGSSPNPASEGLYDTHHSRAASRRSHGHDSPEMHNYPFIYTRIGDELQSGIENQEVYDEHLDEVKRMDFDLLPMPKGYDFPCRYRGIGDKQELDLADYRACGPHRTKIVMGHSPHRSPKGRKHSFRYREIEDEQQSGVDHEAFDLHQSTKKGLGCGCFLRPKENHPVKHRGTDCSWPSTAAQRASGPR